MKSEPTLDDHPDGRVRRGNATRRTVLRRAVDVASVEGLEGLSIGRLATELSISKSGLFALFGAKEELQLSTIRAAKRIYVDTVVTPALESPPGIGQVWALMSAWLDYSRERVFPGGCFFAKTSYEFAGRPGDVHDALAAARHEWLELIEHALTEAQGRGELDGAESPAQLAFELNSFLDGANLDSLLSNDDDVYTRAQHAIGRRLASVNRSGVEPWATA
ncbi:TetR/AcrR family transcriptional regulator [Mumia sp. Pv 4-285]|uniref:TetR/AcrR family transcriptional regulator n=1 Tax=Mumia qirimensis TaxID=3234852 RepID=UPI00351CC075